MLYTRDNFHSWLDHRPSVKLRESLLSTVPKCRPWLYSDKCASPITQLLGKKIWSSSLDSPTDTLNIQSDALIRSATMSHHFDNNYLRLSTRKRDFYRLRNFFELQFFLQHHFLKPHFFKALFYEKQASRNFELIIN